MLHVKDLYWLYSLGQINDELLLEFINLWSLRSVSQSQSYYQVNQLHSLVQLLASATVIEQYFDLVVVGCFTQFQFISVCYVFVLTSPIRIRNVFRRSVCTALMSINCSCWVELSLRPVYGSY